MIKTTFKACRPGWRALSCGHREQDMESRPYPPLLPSPPTTAGRSLKLQNASRGRFELDLRTEHSAAGLPCFATGHVQKIASRLPGFAACQTVGASFTPVRQDTTSHRAEELNFTNQAIAAAESASSARASSHRVAP